MWILDLLKKRSLTFQSNVVLLASGISVGFTKCYLLSAPPESYLACLFVGFFWSALVAIVATALSSIFLNLEKEEIVRYRETIIIIVSITLMTASLFILLGSFLPSDDLD